jgi:glycosyltransferase involved in cell wall biosynthesis
MITLNLSSLIIFFMTYDGKKISVVIPAFNEEQNISSVVKDFSKKYVDEIIVIDNNSSDKTGKLAKKSGAKVILEKKKGYGNAIRRGLKEASGDVIIVTEADQTFRGNDMEKLLSYIDDADLVLGTRTCMQLVGKGANMGLFLRFGNIFIAKFLEFLFGHCRLTDVGCTFRAIKKRPLKRIIKKFKVGGSHFSPEMILVALSSGLKVVEIPVNYGKRVGVGKITSAGQLKAFKVGLDMLWLIFSRKFL